MKFTLYVEDIRTLHEALESTGSGIRFGTEFCEWKIPSLSLLQKAYELTAQQQKEFSYVTPRLPVDKFNRVREHLEYLNGVTTGEIKVIFNDWGVLNIIGDKYLHLRPHLGRQLVSIPLRCQPPVSKFFKNEGLIARFTTAKIFKRTNLSYKPTLHFLRNCGVTGMDIDWLPACFPSLGPMAKKQFHVAVHMHLSIVAITRHCHTARFLGEKKPENCSRPCFHNAFSLRQNDLGDLYLHGNTVFDLTYPIKKDFRYVKKSQAEELVITTGPLTRLMNKEDIDTVISLLCNWS